MTDSPAEKKSFYEQHPSALDLVEGLAGVFLTVASLFVAPTIES